MATTIYLVRHGATEGSEERRYKGTIDVPLSPDGIDGARASARYIKKCLPGGVSAVYSSTLGRAINSARPIAELFGLEVTPLSGLIERHFGIWEGMSFDEIMAEYPDDFKAWAANPLHFSPLQGESTQQVSDRVVPVVTGLVTKHKDQTIVIVGHGGVNRSTLCHFMGLSLNNIFRIEQQFSCVNVIEIHDDGVAVIKLLNGTPC